MRALHIFPVAGLLCLLVSAELSAQDAATKEIRKFEGHRRAVSGACFLPDGKHVLTAGEDKTVRLWEIESGKEKRAFAHDSAVYAVRISPKGDRFLALREDDFFLWEIEGKEPIHHFRPEQDDQIVNACFSMDGKTIGYVTASRKVFTVSLEDKKPICIAGPFPQPRWVEQWWKIAFFKDGRIMLANAQDVRILDGASGKVLASSTAPFKSFCTIALSPDESCFITTTKEVGQSLAGPIQIWAVETKAAVFSFGSAKKSVTIQIGEGPLRVLEGHTRPVNALAVSPNGKRALSGSGVLGWELLVWSSDKKRAARDDSVRLWDIATGKELACFRGHTSGITSVTFSPDGQHALSSSMDGTARLWQLPK